MSKLFFSTLFFLDLVSFSLAQTTAPKPFGPVPTQNQVRWQEMNIMPLFIFQPTLLPTRNTQNNDAVGYAEVDVITD